VFPQRLVGGVVGEAPHEQLGPGGVLLLHWLDGGGDRGHHRGGGGGHHGARLARSHHCRQGGRDCCGHQHVVLCGSVGTLGVCCGVCVSPSNVTTLLSPLLLSHVTQAVGVQRFCAWQADFTRLQFDRFLFCDVARLAVM